MAVAAPPAVRTPSTAAFEALAAVARDIGDVAQGLGREDLRERTDLVSRRAARTETIVCVVGEFKNGKSALINALLGTVVCPVDDDLATSAVTVVRSGDTASAEVHRRDGEARVIESIEPGALADWVQEQPGGGSRRDVELVDVRVPGPILASGLTLVDTPGVGGLNAGHAAATLAFLPSADALVFVTDASAELSAAELEFLASARSAGPPVLVALTKIDMYPEWRRILDLDVGHLATVGLDERPFPLSSVLRMQPDEIDDESGYGAFAEALAGEVVERARSATLAASAAELEWVVGQLREPLATEAAGLADPEAAARLREGATAARERLAALKRADAGWSARLDDAFAELRTRVAFAFQRDLRAILRDAQAEVEAGDPAGTWPELSARVQDRIASAVRAAFREASSGAGAVQGAIADLLADEESGTSGEVPTMTFDVDALWTDAPAFEGRTRSRLGSGYGLVTGAKAGVELLGLVGTLLGAAIVGPAVLGVAAVYGGKEVLDERRRRLTDRRQQARTFLAELIEEIRFQVEGRLTGVMDEMQRQMRARFQERIAELHRTAAASALALDTAARRELAERRARAGEVDRVLAELDRLRERLPVRMATD